MLGSAILLVTSTVIGVLAEGDKPKDPAAPKDANKLLSAADKQFRDKAYEASIRLYGEALAVAGTPALKLKAYYGR